MRELGQFSSGNFERFNYQGSEAFSKDQEDVTESLCELLDSLDSEGLNEFFSSVSKDELEAIYHNVLPILKNPNAKHIIVDKRVGFLKSNIFSTGATSAKAPIEAIVLDASRYQLLHSLLSDRVSLVTGDLISRLDRMNASELGLFFESMCNRFSTTPEETKELLLNFKAHFVASIPIARIRGKLKRAINQELLKGVAEEQLSSVKNDLEAEYEQKLSELKKHPHDANQTSVVFKALGIAKEAEERRLKVQKLAKGEAKSDEFSTAAFRGLSKLQRFANFLTEDIPKLWKKVKLAFHRAPNDQRTISLAKERMYRSALPESDISDLVVFGKNKVKDKITKNSYAARLALSMSSSVVQHSDEYRYVCDTLITDKSTASAEMDPQARAQIKKDLRRYFLNKDPKFFGKLNIFRDGGDPYTVTELEMESLEEVIAEAKSGKMKTKESKILSKEEIESLELYLENLKRSLDINYALCSLLSDSSYKEVGSAKKFEDDLQRLSQHIVLKCRDLKDGEAVFIDNMIDDHAMRICIKKEGKEFLISNYDSSGAIDRTSKAQKFISLMHLLLFESKEHALKSNSYEFRIPEERLYAKGKDYLRDVLYLGTGRGIAEQKERFGKKSNKKPSVILKIASFFSYFLGSYFTAKQLQHFRTRSEVYLNFKNKFDAISLSTSKAKFSSLKQHTQITRDCFAKRTESSRLYQLGIKTQKKFRRAFLDNQRRNLMRDLVEGKELEDGMVEAILKGAEHQYDLKERSRVIRSPDELSEISVELASLKEVPTPKAVTKELDKFIGSIKQIIVDIKTKGASVKNEKFEQAIEREIEQITSEIAAKKQERDKTKNKSEKAERQKEMDELLSQRKKKREKLEEVQELKLILKLTQDSYKEFLDEFVKHYLKEKVIDRPALFNQYFISKKAAAAKSANDKEKLSFSQTSYTEKTLLDLDEDDLEDDVSVETASLSDSATASSVDDVVAPDEDYLTLDISNPNVVKEVAEYYTKKRWLSIFEILDHNTERQEVRRRFLTDTSEHLYQISYSDTLKAFKGKREELKAALKGANIVSFMNFFSRLKGCEVEIQVGDERKELKKEDFLKLLKREVPEILIEPEILEMLEFLRSEDPNMRAIIEGSFLDLLKKQMMLDLQSKTIEYGALRRNEGAIIRNDFVAELNTILGVNHELLTKYSPDSSLYDKSDAETHLGGHIEAKKSFSSKQKYLQRLMLILDRRAESIEAGDAEKELIKSQVGGLNKLLEEERGQLLIKHSSNESNELRNEISELLSSQEEIIRENSRIKDEIQSLKEKLPEGRESYELKRLVNESLLLDEKERALATYIALQKNLLQQFTKNDLSFLNLGESLESAFIFINEDGEVHDKKSMVDVNISYKKKIAELERLKENKDKLINDLKAYQDRHLQQIEQTEQHFKEAQIELSLRERPEQNLFQHLSSFDGRSKKEQQTELRESSLTYKIQHVNRSLYEQAKEIVDKKWEQIEEASISEDIEEVDITAFILEKSRGTPSKESLAEALSSSDTISKLNELKDSWVAIMARVWLQHENQLQLSLVMQKEEDELVGEFNHLFISWLEDNTKMSKQDFVDSGINTLLSKAEVESLVYDLSGQEGGEDNTRAKRVKSEMDKAASVIQNAFQKRAKRSSRKEVYELSLGKDVEKGSLRTAIKSIFRGNFLGVDTEYDESLQYGGRFGSSIDFLRAHPEPIFETYPNTTAYYEAFKSYIDIVLSNEGLEKREDRALASIDRMLQNLLENYPARGLTQTQAEELKLVVEELFLKGSSLEEYLTGIDNETRSNFLRVNLAIDLCSMPCSEEGRIKLKPETYSDIWQIKENIFPLEEILKTVLERLEEDDDALSIANAPKLEALVFALRQSPVGLEGVIEGKAGIQDALYQYRKGISVDERGSNSEIRQLSDLLDLRCGEALLFSRFIQYYGDGSDTKLADLQRLSSSKGREYFQRILSSICSSINKNGNAEQKRELKLFFERAIQEFEKSAEEESAMKISISSYLKQMQLRCALDLNDESFMGLSSLESFMENLSTNVDPKLSGELVLLDLSVLIENLGMQIEFLEKFQELDPDRTKIDKALAELACARLAYSRLEEQIPDEILENFKEDFTYRKAIQTVAATMSAKRELLEGWLGNLDELQGEVLKNTLEVYQGAKKIDGIAVKTKLIEKGDIKGFLKLSSKEDWDVIHGVVYVNGNKQSSLPDSIKNHPDMKKLSLDKLSFSKKGSSYIYSEQGEVKVCVEQRGEDVVIQRRLQNFNLEEDMLQYLPFSKVLELPAAIRDRMGAKDYYLDKSGYIYGVSQDGEAIFRLKEEESGEWLIESKRDPRRGSVEGEERWYNISTKQISPIQTVLRVAFAREEILELENGSEYWIPSLNFHFVRQSEYTWKVEGGEFHNKLLLLDEQDTESISTDGVFLSKELSLASQQNIGKLEEALVDLSAQVSSLEEKSFLSLIEKDLLEKLKGKVLDKQDEIAAIKDGVFIKIASDKLEAERLSTLRKETEVIKNYSSGFSSISRGEVELRKAELENYRDQNPLSIRAFRKKYSSGTFSADSIASILEIFPRDLKSYNLLYKKLSEFELTSPLGRLELERVHDNIDNSLNGDSTGPMGKELQVYLICFELRHHQLCQEEFCRGKRESWDQERVEFLMQKLETKVASLKVEGEKASAALNKIWQLVKSEWGADISELDAYFEVEALEEESFDLGLLNMPYQKSDMPIDLMDLHSACSYELKQGEGLELDRSQKELAANIRAFGETQNQSVLNSVKEEEEGFLFENYGLFSQKSLLRLFRVSPDHPGIAKLSMSECRELFEFIKDAEPSWVEDASAVSDGMFQLSSHPKEFFASHKLNSYLQSQRFTPYEVEAIVDRLEKFFYQAAFNGGTFSAKTEESKELIRLKVESSKNENLTAYLEAKDKLEQLLYCSSGRLSFLDLKEAFLFDDYSRVISALDMHEDIAGLGIKDPSNKSELSAILRNAISRMIYHNTELHHLNDIEGEIARGNFSKVVQQLHTKRNYDLGVLLKNEDELPLLSEVGVEASKLPEVRQENKRLIEELRHAKKLARAFLLFEEDFQHRCNSKQVEVFEGLLADSSLDPKKLDAAQARMGFGKTSLLPLIALLSADGERLTRFIVPPSALATNTKDLSSSLGNILGRRAVRDDFKRYHIAPETKVAIEGEGEELVDERLESLKVITKDLNRRLHLYQQVRDQRLVLTQAPHVRNAIENQLKIFIKILPSLSTLEQKQEMMESINLLNQIRSMRSVSIFDELDATQDPLTTDVNFTTGSKIPFDRDEIPYIESVINMVQANPSSSKEELADECIRQFFPASSAKDKKHYKEYMLEAAHPFGGSSEPPKKLLLFRAFLSDDGMFSLLLDKEPNRDFGVWFQNNEFGERCYDYRATNPSMKPPLRSPLLLAIPYRAANEPKAQGSRFDNPEVTAMATLRYYMDSKTAIEEVPHLEFLLESFREENLEEFFMRADGSLSPLFAKIKKVAEIEDRVVRLEARASLFEEIQSSMPEFRTYLSKVIVARQLSYDSGKANSNRYEQGHIDDELIGFSGTSGDTSSAFKVNFLDPAADGNMTLGIMGRKDCQKCHLVDVDATGQDASTYTRELITEICTKFTSDTRVLIDVGGLCKASNKEVAKSLLDIRVKNNPDLKGVIFYDDITDTKKLMLLDPSKVEGYDVVDLSSTHEKKSNLEGPYLTYFDQSHSRGANIPQKDRAQAFLTMSLGVSNSDYKQGIMRMRKIIDKSLGQNFSVILSTTMKQRILAELCLESSTEITGNHVAQYLREKEIKEEGGNVAGVLKSELEAVVKNAFLQQQAKMCVALNLKKPLSPELISKFSAFIEKMEGELEVSLIDEAQTSLLARYGGVLKKEQKEAFLTELSAVFSARLTNLSRGLQDFAAEAGLEEEVLGNLDEDMQKYSAFRDSILAKRKEQLPEEFELKKAESLSTSEVQSDSQTEEMSENQSESESESEAQTHSFSQVQAEEMEETIALNLDRDKRYKKVDLDFLLTPESLPAISAMPHYERLFNGNKNIVCSPKYIEKMEMMLGGDGAMVAPRYLLVNLKAEAPEYIMLDQDEADAFYKGVNPTATENYGLVDIREHSSSYWQAIIKGANNGEVEGNIFLTDTRLNTSQFFVSEDFKKILLASFRLSIDSFDSLESLFQSLGGTLGETTTGLVQEYDLAPHLSLEDSVESPESYLRLEKWGMRARSDVDIELSLQRGDRGEANIQLGSDKVEIKKDIHQRLIDKLDSGDPLEKGVVAASLEDTLREKEAAENERRDKLIELDAKRALLKERVSALSGEIRKTEEDLEKAKTEPLEGQDKSCKQLFLEDYQDEVREMLIDKIGGASYGTVNEDIKNANDRIKTVSAKRTNPTFWQNIYMHKALKHASLTHGLSKEPKNYEELVELLYEKYGEDAGKVKEVLRKFQEAEINTMHNSCSLKIGLINLAKQMNGKQYGFGSGRKVKLWGEGGGEKAVYELIDLYFKDFFGDENAPSGNELSFLTDAIKSLFEKAESVSGSTHTFKVGTVSNQISSVVETALEAQLLKKDKEKWTAYDAEKKERIFTNLFSNKLKKEPADVTEEEKETYISEKAASIWDAFSAEEREKHILKLLEADESADGMSDEVKKQRFVSSEIASDEVKKQLYVNSKKQKASRQGKIEFFKTLFEGEIRENSLGDYCQTYMEAMVDKVEANAKLKQLKETFRTIETGYAKFLDSYEIHGEDHRDEAIQELTEEIISDKSLSEEEKELKRSILAELSSIRIKYRESEKKLLQVNLHGSRVNITKLIEHSEVKWGKLASSKMTLTPRFYEAMRKFDETYKALHEERKAKIDELKAEEKSIQEDIDALVLEIGRLKELIAKLTLEEAALRKAALSQDELARKLEAKGLILAEQQSKLLEEVFKLKEVLEAFQEPVEEELEEGSSADEASDNPSRDLCSGNLHFEAPHFYRVHAEIEEVEKDLLGLANTEEREVKGAYKRAFKLVLAEASIFRDRAVEVV